MGAGDASGQWGIGGNPTQSPAAQGPALGRAADPDHRREIRVEVSREGVMIGGVPEIRVGLVDDQADPVGAA